MSKNLTVALCSWNAPELLMNCVTSLIFAGQEPDNIKVVLNEADIKSVKFLMSCGIDFVASASNRGVLAIDHVLSLIDTEYFMTTNDDMLFHSGFQDDLISIINNNYPAAASCSLVEPVETGNSVVISDDLGSAGELNTLTEFLKNVSEGKYKGCNRISYNHPIMVRTEDLIKVGGYSNNLDKRFHIGYGADDFFAYRLWKLHNGNFKTIASGKSFVYHGISQSMGRIDKDIRDSNSGREPFEQEAGMSISEFREKINHGSKV